MDRGIWFVDEVFVTAHHRIARVRLCPRFELAAVAVHVFGHPTGFLMDPLISRHRTHVPPCLEHPLSAVRRDPRHDVKEAFSQGIAQGRWPSVHAVLGRHVERQKVFGHSERNARTAQLRSVKIAVDPGGWPDSMGLGSDGQHPNGPTLRGCGQAVDTNELWKTA